VQSRTGGDAANKASAADRLRLAELIAALSLATDLGTGQPLERAIRACLVATQLAERLNLSSDERADVYYLPLLAMLGCTAESSEASEVFGDELAFGAAVAPFFLGQPHETMRWMLAHFAEDEHLLRRAARLVRAIAGSGQVMAQAAASHCEVAQGLGDRLGFGPRLRAGLGAIYTRWDGTGKPGHSREEIPLATRILHVAWDAQLFHRLGGESACLEMARARAGRALDPEVVDVLCRGASDVLAVLNAPSAWEAVLALEPRPWRVVPEPQMDDFVSVFADFADLKTT